LQVVAAVQDRTQVVDQVADSSHRQVHHMEATSVVPRERSRREVPSEREVVALRLQAAVAADFGVELVVPHTQVAAVVHRSLAQVCMGSLTHLLLPLVVLQYACAFLKQQRWFLPHNSQERAGHVRANSRGLFHHSMM
jgi:hypothetical protein